MHAARENFLWFAVRLVPLGLLWFAVYGYTNSAAEARAPVALAFSWEHDVPLVHSAIWVYLTIPAVFWLPLFVLPRAAIRTLMVRYIAVTLAAGAVFLILPTSVALERASGHLPQPWQFLYSFDAPNNAAPSLHVAYAVLVLAACARWLRGRARLAVWVWLVLIALSAWLTHQHQIADVVAGAALGWIAARGITPPVAPERPR